MFEGVDGERARYSPSGSRLLVVGEDDALRREILDVLGRAGYRVRAALGAQSLSEEEFDDDDCPDLVLIDRHASRARCAEVVPESFPESFAPQIADLCVLDLGVLDRTRDGAPRLRRGEATRLLVMVELRLLIAECQRMERLAAAFDELRWLGGSARDLHTRLRRLSDDMACVVNVLTTHLTRRLSFAPPRDLIRGLLSNGAKLADRAASLLARKRQPSKRPRLMVVDDEPMIGELIACVLGDELEIETFEDARVALDVLARGADFDVVLTDVTMPGMSGIELYWQLVVAHPTLARHVVFMTGGIMQARLHRFVQAHEEGPLTKPFTCEQLRTYVGRALDRVDAV